MLEIPKETKKTDVFEEMLKEVNKAEVFLEDPFKDLLFQNSTRMITFNKELMKQPMEDITRDHAKVLAEAIEINKFTYELLAQSLGIATLGLERYLKEVAMEEKDDDETD